jgi:hypothetical protein
MSVVGVIFLSACQKQSENAPSTVALSSHIIPPTTQTTAAQTDTIPDGAILKIKLQQDSAAIDETLLLYKHSATGNFTNYQDAPYFAGFGRGSLASVTRDGISCVIQTVPFCRSGGIPLKITAKNDGVYLLKTSLAEDIPASLGIWLKDAYRKDSVNMRLWNYRFDVIRMDTNTYAHRFSIVIH